jgi:hypothetical protein
LLSVRPRNALRRSLARAALLLLAAATVSAPAGTQERIGGATFSREKIQGSENMRIRVAAEIGGTARPAPNGQVTAIPYDRSLPTVQLKIRGIGERRAQNCTSLKLYNWPIELEDIADAVYAAYRGRQEGHLGQLLILHPPRLAAKAMSPASVRPRDLPRSATPSTLFAAFDFDADGRADLVEMTTCCGKLDKKRACAPGDSCVKSYRRDRKAWRLIDQREEC